MSYYNYAKNVTNLLANSLSLLFLCLTFNLYLVTLSCILELKYRRTTNLINYFTRLPGVVFLIFGNDSLYAYVSCC